MSFQAYLDNIETKTGVTPRRFIDLATEQGFDAMTKPSVILTWLKQDHDLGHGHATAMARVITNGDRISAKHVGPEGSHRDARDRLWLDGKDTKPVDW